MDRIRVDDAEIEYEVRADGEPVLLIPLSVVIDGLAHPLFGQPALAGEFRLIHYPRRGWSGSTLRDGPVSIAGPAADAVALLEHLGIVRAHAAGHSYGGVIALQLALDAPELVQSVALLEPALRAGPEGRAHLQRIIGPARERYGSGDKRGFITVFTDGVFGPGWEPVVERAVPGAIERAEVGRPQPGSLICPGFRVVRFLESSAVEEDSDAPQVPAGGSPSGDRAGAIGHEGRGAGRGVLCQRSVDL